MGRKLLLDDETQAAIVTAVASGAPVEVCARYAGVGSSTLRRWMELGKPDQPCTPAEDPEHIGAEAACSTPPEHEPGACPKLARYRAFREAVERAEDALHIGLVAEMVKAGKRDWHAGQAVLKAKWPKTWNVPQITQLQGGLEVEVTLTARETVRAKLEQMAERGLLALPAGTEDDGERLDSEEDDDDATDTARDEADESSEGRPEPEPERKRRGPAFA